MDPYYGEIRLFCGTYAPADWMFCDGSILPIYSYQALYALISNTYGGNMKAGTFALPDFRNMVPMGWGQGLGLINRPWGTTGGSNTFEIGPNNMPTHNHLVNALTTTGTVSSPDNAIFAGRGFTDRDYVNMTALPTAINTPMIGTSLSATGVTQMQNLTMQQPYCGINFIICVTNGIWPPKPD